jgi:hypothetical protein
MGEGVGEGEGRGRGRGREGGGGGKGRGDNPYQKEIPSTSLARHKAESSESWKREKKMATGL